MEKIPVLTIALIMSLAISAQGPLKRETVIINGKKTYYEVYGSEKPLLLLQGYGQSS